MSLEFNETILLLALVGYEMITSNSALRALLVIYHLMSKNTSEIIDYYSNIFC